MRYVAVAETSLVGDHGHHGSNGRIVQGGHRGPRRVREKQCHRYGLYNCALDIETELLTVICISSHLVTGR